MMTVGTRIRDVRTGRIATIRELRSGAKAVTNGTGWLKIIPDSEIARWFYEVPVNYALRDKLAAKLAEMGAELVVKKSYSLVTYKGVKLNQVRVSKTRLEVRFYPRWLSAKDKLFAVECPRHFNRVQNWLMSVKTYDNLAKVLEVIKKEIQEINKNGKIND